MHPIFARLRPQLERAKEEMARLAAFRDGATFPDERTARWGIAVATAAAVENVYGGVEEILKSIAANIDESLPRGDQWHRELLDQMAVDVDARPALMTAELRDQLDELRQFRHLVRHRYGSELEPARVEAMYRLCEAALAEFESQFTRLGAELSG